MTDIEQKVIKEICKVAHIDDISDLSDGHHTFRQLYYQRMMLFAALVKQNRDKAWKSLCHEDGELCFGGGWFIVGIDTPEGSYTYHYEDNYFSLFDCVELERGKHWDGHTEEDVTRLLSLERETCNDAISRQVVQELYYKDGYIDFRKICELRPVAPQPKMGEWYLDDEWRCSVCNCVCEDWRGIPTYKYCPQCGSYVGKMQEVE